MLEQKTLKAVRGEIYIYIWFKPSSQSLAQIRILLVAELDTMVSTPASFLGSQPRRAISLGCESRQQRLHRYRDALSIASLSALKEMSPLPMCVGANKTTHG